MIKTLLIGAGMAIAVAGSANAADFRAAPAPAAPIFTWTGFYLGATVGWLGEDKGSTVGTPAFINTALGNPIGSVAGLSRTVTGSTSDISSIMGGGTLGYNYQMGAIVAGVETDIGVTARSKDSRAFRESISATEFITGNVSSTNRYNYFGTVRARLGYLLMPNLLVFATGGFAYADKQSTTTFDTGAVNVFVPASSARVSRSGTTTGYVVGGGLEYALDASWSVKAEGLYYDMGRSSGSSNILLLGLGGAAPFVSSNIRSTGQDRGVIARVGLNYKFNWF